MKNLGREKDMFTLRRMCGARGVARAGRFAAAFAFGALGLCGLGTSNAYAQTGWVRQYTGQQAPQGVRPLAVPPCYGTYCQFWEPVDRNAFTARIAADSAGHIYQLHYTGAIYQYPDAPCTSFCPGWWFRGFDPATKAIYAYEGDLYKLHQDGSVWQATSGTAWSVVANADPGRITIAVGGDRMASLYVDGSITIDQTSFGRQLGHAVAIAIDGHADIYRLSLNGDIEVFGRRDGVWRPLDNNPATVAIAAGDWGMLYQLHDNGSIWKYTGQHCDFQQPYPQCRGWEKVDNNPAAVKIVAAGQELYKLQGNGSLWRYTGTSCIGESCPGWELIMGDGVGQVAAAGDHLYVLSGAAGPRPARQPACSQCL